MKYMANQHRAAQGLEPLAGDLPPIQIVVNPYKVQPKKPAKKQPAKTVPKEQPARKVAKKQPPKKAAKRQPDTGY